LSTKRILQNDFSSPETNNVFNYQMNLYNLHKKEFAEHFTSRRPNVSTGAENKANRSFHVPTVHKALAKSFTVVEKLI
jgi:hypothetical protein